MAATDQVANWIYQISIMRKRTYEAIRGRVVIKWKFPDHLCGKLEHDDQWVSLEEFFASKFRDGNVSRNVPGLPRRSQSEDEEPKAA